MIVLPAIDLKNGECVRLYKGDFNTAGKVADSPYKAAENFKKSGAVWLHVVDLDGAKTGERPNRELIVSLASRAGLNIELGGGIRDMSAVEDYLGSGISRVILGSAALKSPEFVKSAVARFADRVAVGIDARDGFVSTEGWLKKSDVTYIDFAKEMEQAGVKYLIFTDISRDGTLNGPNFSQLEELKNAVSCIIIASGGVKDISHVRKLRQIGMYGAICGKSVYEGTLDVAEAVMEGGSQDAC